MHSVLPAGMCPSARFLHVQQQHHLLREHVRSNGLELQYCSVRLYYECVLCHVNSVMPLSCMCCCYHLGTVHQIGFLIGYSARLCDLAELCWGAA